MELLASIIPHFHDQVLPMVPFPGLPVLDFLWPQEFPVHFSELPALDFLYPQEFLVHSFSRKNSFVRFMTVQEQHLTKINFQLRNRPLESSSSNLLHPRFCSETRGLEIFSGTAQFLRFLVFVCCSPALRSRRGGFLWRDGNARVGTTQFTTMAMLFDSLILLHS
ncbi:unnamed protein product [Haemonchus placei]|uniref:UDENN domain-containing protein n=1 Tax=Haemonchus placei TaxID=6290 RepID=A0A0N4XAY7_HAEPC|nr:unnamed protein product [Haemonchus placei]